MIICSFTPEIQDTLLLLLAGHVLADFVFQTRAMVEGKKESSATLWLHGLEVYLVQALPLLFFQFASGSALLVILVITCLHVLTDWLKVVVERKWGPRLVWFFLDQGFHVLAIAGTLWAWHSCCSLDGMGPIQLSDGWLQVGCALAISYGFAVHGGNAIVSALLLSLRNKAQNPMPASVHVGAGTMIGILERLIIVTLVWQGEWGAMGFVLAGKSIARYKELEEKSFAEIYLVGTLTSFLVAGALGGFLQWMVP
ncbi:MAG: DUF3307 domain-containing protein [bacterium]|nr:DUF3307 domain-containing protein [bacterium]